MPFIKYETEGLTSMRQAAEIVGLSSTHFWKLCRESELIRPPETKVGRREFYNEKELDRVIRQVADLRKQGVL